ncbi:ABC-type transport auxiliary lipoprotein family protein [Magnetospirillum sulfuroxidans]|uniref:Membrane integrity-associated transporter subunit PqiC n=1 Tax=Magnetospirillum sulfuroxidans TaxID=611300 RepID=A0ABS5IA46_9PROT|nr:ABC-type transport auxiliary lipoprotein family protein [Magnetospirillum sulfuroxidans]MBR9971285.1 membrane integrity-associated transporter subunit PqiC [Magnetospirillum sulfuroxidans]
MILSRLLLSCAMAALVAACAQPAPPKDRFYRLETARQSALFSTPALGIVEVGHLSTDGVLSERPLAYQDADGALGRYRYDLWAEPPTALLQGALVEALRQSGIAATVITPETRVPPDWIVRGRLNRFEMTTAAGQANAAVELTVVSARDGSLLLLKSYQANISSAAGPQAEVAALTRASSDIIAAFLADLGRAAQTMKTSP